MTLKSENPMLFGMKLIRTAGDRRKMFCFFEASVEGDCIGIFC